MAGLPTPVTAVEVILTAVHAELVGLRADLATARGGETAPPAPAGTTELREPKPARRTTKAPQS